MTSTWNPEQYNRFRAERQQPFYDLLALVRPRPRMRVVDLGCGTGELTRIVHETLGAGETLGLDSSETMLADSDAHALAGLRFARVDIAEFAAAAAYDLVFSNAALHWLPDHPALFARLTAALASEGQLAVQMPFNFDHPSHTVAAAVAPLIHGRGRMLWTALVLAYPFVSAQWFGALPNFATIGHLTGAGFGLVAGHVLIKSSAEEPVRPIHEAGAANPT